MNRESVLKEIFLSPEMADYLSKRPLDREKIAEIIAGAPISLERKRELLLALAEEEKSSFFSRTAKKISYALQETRLKPGEIFYLKTYYYNESGRPGMEAIAPFLTWEQVLERIQKILGYQGDGEDALIWFNVEKWTPDGNGRLKNTYDFTVIGGEACYFYCRASFLRERICFAESRDLNLPVPFRAGDLVTVDCRPYAPLNHAVILEVGDNRDCCCLQALFRIEDGMWDTGAVKHGSLFPIGCLPDFSPLYRMKVCRETMPEEDGLLEKVSRFVNESERRGAELWEYIFELQDKTRRETQGVEEEQILPYMEKNNKF